MTNRAATSETDPLHRLSSNDLELVFQHFRCKPLLNLSQVSQSWAEEINQSFFVMKKTSFNFSDESQSVLMESTRKYQNIRVTQDIFNHDPEYLPKLLNLIRSLRSLSFQGDFEMSCVREFFQKFKMNTAVGECRLDHVTFIGEVTNIEKILCEFSNMLPLMNKNSYESIELIEVPSNTFSNIFKDLRTRKLILKGMIISRPNADGFCGQKFMTHLEMFSTRIDKAVAEKLRDFCFNLETLSIDDLNSLDEEVKLLFTQHPVAKPLTIVILPAPNFHDFIVRLPEELHSLIFQHLTREDLMNTTAACKTFFNFSKKFIESRFVFNSMRRTALKRKYQNLDVVILNDVICLNKIFPLAQNLREMTIEVEPEAIKNVVFLFSLQKFQNLTLLNIASHCNAPLDDLRFPTSLTILHLTNFNLKLMCQHPDRIPFYQFLKNAKHLIELKMFDSFGMEKLFQSNVFQHASKFPFKLQTLKLPIHDNSKGVRKNFDKFLVSQSKSLEYLGMHTVHVKTLHTLTQSRFKLKFLGILIIEGSTGTLNDRADSLLTLNELQLPQIKGKHRLKILSPLIGLAPNVERVQVPRLTDDMLHYLHKTFKSLKEIHFSRKCLNGLKNDVILKCYKRILLIGGNIAYLDSLKENSKILNEIDVK